MNRFLAAAGALVLVVGLDSGAQPLNQTARAPKQAVLPDDAAAAIGQTPCQEAAQISAEACLLWLSRPPVRDPDADSIARGHGKGPAEGAAAVALGLWGGPEPEAEAESPPELSRDTQPPQ